MNSFCIYWEKVDILCPNESLKTTATFNNLFGFHYMDEEHHKIINELRYNQKILEPSLIFSELSLFIKPLESICSDLSLKLLPTDSISNSSYILLKSKSSLFPYKKLDHFWVSVSPSIASPTLLLDSDLKFELSSIQDLEYIFDVSFTLPNAHPYATLNQTPIIPGRSLLKFQICKPNGHFISIFAKPSHPIQLLYSQLVSQTGYSNFRLIQKQSHSKKRVLTNFSLPLSSVIVSSSRNILFIEKLESSLLSNP